MEQLKSCSPEELVIRENFKRDYKLSCPVMDDEDVFAKSLRIQHLADDWSDYLEMSKRIDDLDDFRKKLRNKITSFVSAVKGFDQLAPQEYRYNFRGDRIYLKDENVGKRIISLDLVKGNYQSLKHLGTQYVLDTENYEDLIRRFTNEKCLINSKFFRQMVFGLLRPDVQGSVQRNMLGEMIEQVFQKVREFPIVHLSNDEVMFVIESDEELESIQNALQDITYQYRVSEFRLEKILNGYNEPWYVRYYVNSSDQRPPRLMGIHVRYLMQVSNFIEGVSNTEKDFWWRERGRLCKLLEPESFGTSTNE